MTPIDQLTQEAISPAISEGWISVKDRLPEHEQNIVGLNSFTGGTWAEIFDELEPLGFMSHWMPSKPTGLE
jgi:hypothetical protein